MITNISNVLVNISGFYSKYNYTDVYCTAVFQNKEYNSSLYLLKASMKDKTFDRNMSNALGYQVKMQETDWVYVSETNGIKSTTKGMRDKKRTPDLG